MSPFPILLVCLVGAFTQPSAGDEVPELRRLTGLMHELRSPIRDYECLFEGRRIRLTSLATAQLPQGMRIAAERDPSFKAGHTTTYQGVFAFRSDNCAILDLSVRSDESRKPMTRNIFSVFRSQGSHRTIVPDRGGLIGPDAKQSANLLYFKNQLLSLISLDVNPYLQEQLELRDTLVYFDATWDDVQERRCLAFSLDRQYKGNMIGQVERYWVDLARGGSVLRREMMVDGRLANRLDEIKLIEMPTEDGKKVWFPVSGKERWFDLSAATAVAYLEQTYEVLAGSLKINQDLGDERFSLDYGQPLQITALAKEYNSGRIVPPNLGPTPSAKALSDVIKDINEPSRRLTARTSPASWLGIYGVGVALVFLGATILILIALLKGRT